MNWLLDSDSMFNRFLFRIFDTLMLAVLTIVCSLPIFTIGAAVSALYDMMIKIVLDKDSSLFKSYFKSFKKNFVKGTLIWLICLAGIAFIGLNIYFMYVTGDLNEKLRMVLFIIILLVTMSFAFIGIYAFPLQARYENKVSTTIKNAFFISIAQFPRSLGLLFLNVVIFAPALIAPDVIPLLVILELSLTAYITARNMVKVFAIFGDAEIKGDDVADKKEESNSDKKEENSETGANDEEIEEKDEKSVSQEAKKEDAEA